MLKPERVKEMLKSCVEERRMVVAKMLSNNESISPLSDIDMVSRINTLCSVLGDISYDPYHHKLTEYDTKEADRY